MYSSVLRKSSVVTEKGTGAIGSVLRGVVSSST